MARHLIQAGHDVTVHDARPDAARGPRRPRRPPADTAADCAAAASDALITMLPTPHVVAEVMLGGAGAAAGARSVWIDMSHVHPRRWPGG